MQKQILIVPSLHLGFYCFNDQNLLIVTKKKSSFYTVIPKGIRCIKEKSVLTLELLTSLNVKYHYTIFQSFNAFLVNWLKKIEKPFIKKLFLKGLGLKALIDLNSLELKLGFSHVVKILIPNSITMTIKKTTLKFESSDLLLLGNFLYQIRNLKYPNTYKGKGIWYKNEIKTLKAVKKA